MHRLFNVSEVVFRISKLLDRGGKYGKVDQFNFGITCQVVWEVAVTAVWHSIVDVDCFCRLLPEDIRACTEDAEKIVQPRPLSDVEWQSLLKYTQHVRHLNLGDSVWGGREKRYIESPHYSLFAAVLGSRPDGSPVFPSLQSLKLATNFSYQDSVSAAASFFRTPFVDLELSISASKTLAVKEALETLPALEALDIHWSSSSTDEERLIDHVEREAVLSGLLRRLPNLRKLGLSVCLIDGRSAALAEAVTLPVLEELSISMDVRGKPRPSRILPAAFPSLKTLDVTTPFTEESHDRLIKLLLCVTSTSVARFRLSCENLIVAKQPLQMVIIWASSLVSVRLSLGTWPTGYTGTVLHFDGLLVLARCHSIQELRIESMDPLEIRDKHYDTITSAWPDLRHLCIWEQTCKEPDEGPRTSKAGRRSLLYLAERCPKLRSLSISIDFDRGTSVKPPKAGAQSCQLEAFHSIWSTSTKTDSAVAFIQQTFPHLIYFDAYNIQGFDETEDGQDRDMVEVIEGLGLQTIGEP